MKLDTIVEAMQEIEKDRSISKEIIIEALEEALAKAFRKHIEIPDAYVRVDVSSDEIKVFHQHLIVGEVEDDALEISLEDAKKIREDYEVGEYFEEEVSIQDFGRIAIILAKNVMKQKTREAQKQAVYDQYSDKLEELVSGIVETVEEKFCLVNIGKTLALMPKVAQIPNEKYYEGQQIRVVISDVNKETKGAQVLVSRADPVLVRRLFEKEVPEIYQGIIEIKAIAREPGERCKMAVYSNNENIDPIGACIGPRGSRVQVIIDELKGEKIDIFEWNEDVSELIKNALAPAEVLAVIPNETKRGLMVIVNDDQLSLAIGKRGKNARLAVKLTNNTIDIKSISDAEAMNINWRDIADAEALRLAEEKEEQRKKAQASLYSEVQHRDTGVEEEYVDELLGEHIIEEEFITEREEVKETPVKKEKEVVAKQKSKEEEALEEAARLVKERKTKGIDIEKKRAYVSKFEDIAGAKKEEIPVVKKKKRRYDESQEEEEIITTPTHNPNEQEYELKPIYTEEELAEIEAQRKAEEAAEWINEDIDFDEYDEFYDEE
ncbi:MAG: transcription termination factor NusA [Breznakia sp.]